MNIETTHDGSPMQGTPVTTTGQNVQSFWQPVRLTHLKPVLTTQDVAIIEHPDLLHKFIIYGIECYEKTEILDTIISSCLLESFLPMMYTVENKEKATFIARCSVGTVKYLVNHGLRIKMQDGNSLAIDIVLGYVSTSEFNVFSQREINLAVKARYDPLRKTLNLDNFKNDKHLRHVYCAISSPRIFHFVIRCCNIGSTRETKLSIRELSLRSNDITGTVPFDKYFNFHLAKIDLRNNAIKDINHLNFLKDHKITELWLDGNPLCSLYATSEDYVKAVKAVFPHVQRLDGVVIEVETKYVPIVKMNYLGDMSKIKLIKQFIQHFFTFYDQNDRNVMNGLYDHDALYSMTLGSITNMTHLQMTKSFANNRNLLKFVDYAKCHEFLLKGPTKIIAALQRQPATYHNYQKFNIDVLHYSDDSLTIAVQGTFSYKKCPYVPLFFNRTFVIVEIDDNEYCIANDQYHIQSEWSSPKNIVNETKTTAIVIPEIVPTIFSRSEKEQLVMFLKERTTMNEEFCQRYLENANWDIRVALESFIKAYTVNDVPPEAFKKYTYTYS